VFHARVGCAGVVIEAEGLIEAITAKNSELLRYALVYTGDFMDNLQGKVFYKGETVTFDKAPKGTVRYVLVRKTGNV